MPSIVSIVGNSESGKTTLIEKLIRELKSRGYRVATIKHTPQGMTFDETGKDSWRHLQAGSEATVISSQDKLVLIKPVAPDITLDEIARWVKTGDEIQILDNENGEDLTAVTFAQIILDGENKDTSAPFIEGPEGKLYPGLRSDIPNLRQKLDTLPEPEPQVTDFAHAVRNRLKFALNEDNGHRSCTIVNLGKIAIRLARPLRYDPVAEQFIGDDAANRYIDQPMRGPWYLPS